ncbi:MAG: lasso peptide, partial [Brasilonema sp.]
PKLTVHGNVAEITQILGGDTRKDFTFLNGDVISQNNDIGSKDLDCTGNLPNLNCTAK